MVDFSPINMAYNKFNKGSKKNLDDEIYRDLYGDKNKFISEIDDAIEENNDISYPHMLVTTQGDVINNDELGGTSIDVLREGKKKKKKHNYYIQQFLREIRSDENDTISITSTKQSDIYEHIRKCKFCKYQIGKKLNVDKDKDIAKTIEDIDNSMMDNMLDDMVDNKPEKEKTGHDIKDIILIIVIGIVIIFILDLFVKLGSRLSIK